MENNLSLQVIQNKSNQEYSIENFDELKSNVATLASNYSAIVYDGDLKMARADRTKLNKLKKAFEDERKRIKKLCMDPYKPLESQVKELVALLDEPIGTITDLLNAEKQCDAEAKEWVVFMANMTPTQAVTLKKFCVEHDIEIKPYKAN